MKQIELTRGRFASVDDDDFDALSAHKWRLRVSTRSSRGTCYAIRSVGGRTVLMHRVIVNAIEGQIVDHINGDGLDNSRSNLRVVTHSQSMMNRVWSRDGMTSRFQGVTWDKCCKKWRAQIFCNGKRIYLGVHAEEDAAYAAYKAACAELFGEFSPRLP